ncbi:MAG: hypothetical protein IAE99_11075 [Rhodothermales bacterium]|nr:hypothetical protein [Rhodothermales bacterium]
MRLLLPLLALVALPACRTVQTVALASSLEEAVSQTRGRGVRIERFDGPALRNATEVRLSERMLSYFSEKDLRRDSLPREQVKALTVNEGSLGTVGRAAAYVGIPSGIGLLADFACCFWSGSSGFGFLGIGLGFGLNYLLNPDRERVIYRAAPPPTP